MAGSRPHAVDVGAIKEQLLSIRECVAAIQDLEMGHHGPISAPVYALVAHIADVAKGIEEDLPEVGTAEKGDE